MSKLEDARHSLYEPGQTPEIEPKFFGRPKIGDTETKKSWEEIQRNTAAEPSPSHAPRKSFRFGMIAAAVFLVGILAVIGVFFFGFQKQDLTIRIFVKDEIESGEKTTYQVSYKNQGAKKLQDVELSFTYPGGSIPLKREEDSTDLLHTRITLGDIEPGKEESIEVSARLFGKAGEVKAAEAVILYRAEDGAARFAVKAKAETKIVRVPLVLNINVPDNLRSNQNVVITVDYSSNAQAPFENMHMGIEYPPGFTFVSADPAPSEGDSVWFLGAIAPGDSGSITINGAISGAPGEIKTFTVQAGPYNALTKEWMPYQTALKISTIATPPLSIEQKVNGAREITVKPGDSLRFQLHYKNNLDITLKNISVEVALGDSTLDLATLEIKDGEYNGAKGKIVWNAASFPAFASLPSKSEGDLEFSIRTSATVPDNIKTPTITSSAVINAGEAPAGLSGLLLSSEDIITAKFTTKLTLSSRALYHNQYIPTLGPLPPKVGQKTSFVIIWQLANSINDTAGVEVRGKLAPGAVWEGTVNPSNASISFDQGSGLIVWRVGSVPAGTGNIKPSPMVAFLVSVTPGENQINQTPALVSSIETKGHDIFANQDLIMPGEPLTTELKSDPTTSAKDWRVVK
ncbi:MAG: hypothetical protein HYT39_01550 [Candidatus Sungbacteria bacterium]|nr:hypothetical protein [Candidatus Sungbacteria bacterium]